MKVFDAATEDCAIGLCLHAARPRERFVRDSVWLRGREMAVVNGWHLFSSCGGVCVALL